jgi:hypothetical protein
MERYDTEQFAFCATSVCDALRRVRHSRIARPTFTVELSIKAHIGVANIKRFAHRKHGLILPLVKFGRSRIRRFA